MSELLPPLSTRIADVLRNATPDPYPSPVADESRIQRWLCRLPLWALRNRLVDDLALDYLCTVGMADHPSGVIWRAWVYGEWLHRRRTRIVKVGEVA